MINYRDKFSGGYISYGKAFGVGFWVVLFSTILGTIFGYFYVTQINPGLAEEILMNTEIETLEKYPDMSDADLDRTLSFTEMFITPIMMTIMGFVVSMFFGTILSLIIAIFVKREGTIEIVEEEVIEE